MQLPTWALEKAEPQDRDRARNAYQKKTGRFTITNRATLKDWMKAQAWKQSRFALEGSFYKQCFQDDDYFRTALEEQVVEMWIPKQSHQVSKTDLASMDKDYNDREWAAAVAQLKDIRRAIDAGVTIEVDGQTFKSSGSFYNWAHKRYHSLEEASDDWILEG